MMAERVLEALERGAVMVTVNRRLARRCREIHDAAQAAAGREVWEDPPILPWGAWLERCLDHAAPGAGLASVPVLLSAEQELTLWEQTVEESPQGRGLLDVAGTAADAREAWRLMHAWRLVLDPGHPGLTPDVRAFASWSGSFRERCREGGWLDRARLPDAVAEHWRRGRLDAPAQLLLAGFDQLDPQQHGLLGEAAARGATVSELEEPGEPRGVRVACADFRAEMTAAARWARARLEQGGRRVGIVVPQLGARLAEVSRILDAVMCPPVLLPEGFSSPRPYNLSLGPPLADYPPVQAALGVLRLAQDATSLEELSALLRTPYLGGAAAEQSARALLDLRLREHREQQVSLSRVLRAAAEPGGSHCSVLGQGLQALQREFGAAPAEQAPSAWAAHFGRCLDALGWPGERPLGSGEYQTVRAWHQQLYALAGLDTVWPRASRGAALRKLARLSAETVFQPEADAAPLQVLGMLEAAGQRFDALWVTGLHAGAWPAAARANPFLPDRLQREKGVAHCSPQRELAFARGLTDRLLRGAREVVVSHPLREDDADQRPSPLVLPLPTVSEADLGLAGFRPYAEIEYGARAQELLTDTQGPAVALEGTVPGGTAVLRDQAACPFRAFARHRLGALAVEKLPRGLEALDRGILVHAALEQLWGRLGSWQGLQASPEAELAALLREAAAAAIAGQVRRRPTVFADRFTAIEQERLEALLREWLGLERTRIPFEVLAREHGQVVGLAGLRLAARADRVDCLDDGSLVVVDYKTGRPRVQSWEGERPDDPQVPLYAVAQGAAVSGALFAQLRRGDVRYLGVASREVAPGVAAIEPDAFATMIQGWRAVLEGLARAFGCGSASVDPKSPSSCEHCGLDSLCRIAEREEAGGRAGAVSDP